MIRSKATQVARYLLVVLDIVRIDLDARQNRMVSAAMTNHRSIWYDEFQIIYSIHVVGYAVVIFGIHFGTTKRAKYMFQCHSNTTHTQKKAQKLNEFQLDTKVNGNVHIFRCENSMEH